MVMLSRGASGAASRFVQAALVVAVVHSLGACQRGVDAARIVVHPLPWASHTFGMAKLAAELSRRGHEVVFVTAEGLFKKVTAITDRFVKTNPADYGEAGGSITFVTYVKKLDGFRTAAYELNPTQIIHMLVSDLHRTCVSLVGNETAMALLRRPPARLFIGEPANQCSWVLSDLLRLPRVDYLPGDGGAEAESLMYGTNSPLSYVPMYGSAQNPAGMTLFGRSANVLTYVIVRTIVYFITDPAFVRLSREVNRTWPPGPPSRLDASRRSILAISGTDFAVEPPRPAYPHIKYVGPLLPEPPVPLPQNFETIMQGADRRGVVVAAFGSLLAAKPRAMLVVARALAALRQTVVWKVVPADVGHELWTEFDEVVNGAKDLHVVPWLPQNDLLGHPATRAFLTHGGIHSLYEAVYHAVPMVVVPIGADQPDNARVLTDYHRVALTVPADKLANMAPEQGGTVLAAALQRVLAEPGFRERVAAVSRRLRAHRQPPVAQAADWVEYALEVDEVEDGFLHTPEPRMSLFQLYLYDVAALAAVTACAALGGPALLVAWCCRRSRRRASPAVDGSHARSSKQD